MKIAYFVWEYPPRLIGGLGTYAAEITKKFVEMGHELIVFTMNENSSLKRREQFKGIDVHRPMVADSSDILPIFVDEELRKWGKGIKFFSDVLTYNFLSANKLINQIAMEKEVDIVICHDWLSSIGGVVAKKGTKKPMVFHVHSTEYGRSGGGGSKTIRDLEFFTGSTADMVITVSYAMQQELLFLKFPPEKIRVCWNGVDEKKYNLDNFEKSKISKFRENLGVKENEKMILFTGRLTWVKGIDTLVRALPMVISKIPNTKLVILGRGEMDKQIAALSHQLNLKNNVIMVNKWVSEEERLLLYASCDLVCAPSRYEPFGIVPLEGMGMKKPVIVGCGGMREIVIEGKHGLYCDPNNSEDVGEKIIRILRDEELARRFGEEGRKRVERLFTWDKIAEDTISLYETLI